jgi:hypothetical protein
MFLYCLIMYYNIYTSTSMRPLQLVNPVDLVPGRTYLIQEKRPEYAHQKFKGTFIKNDYPHHQFQCTITHFTNVIIRGNKKTSDLGLQDTYWNYYEANAVTLAYTNHVLREITSDPSFTYSSITS